jgi:hypothetical protein
LNMSRILFYFAGVFVGVLVAIALMIGVELFSSVVHPLPADFGGTMAEMCEHVAQYPQWVLAVVTIVWPMAAFASTWTANRIGGRAAGLTIGMLLTIGLVFNIAKLPYVVWFKIAIVPLVVTAIALALRPRSTNRI